MSTPNPSISDGLAALAGADIQRLAARMAQDIFTGIFRQAAATEAEPASPQFAELSRHCQDWCQAGADDEARALRLALLISGLDQWGLAYAQAFQLQAIPALTALIGQLRTALDPRAEARFQWFFSQLAQTEADGIDFKIELRRNIHLALWHAMAACDSDEQALPVVRALGSLLVALDEQMPQLGWRLVADALAHIQIGLLAGDNATAVATEGTQQLFGALRQALPAERYQSMLAHAGQAVVAWQQARRPVAPT